MKLISFLYMIIITQTVANAANIKQLLNEQALAIVELKNGEKIEVGESFIASEGKAQCLLEVLSLDKRIVTVSSKACSDKSILTIGKNVEKSLFDAKLTQTEAKAEFPPPNELAIEKEKSAPAPPEERKVEPTAKDSYGSFYIGYMLAPKIVINGTAFTGTSSERGTFEYKFSNAVTFGFEASQFRRNSWNNGVYVNYASLKFDTASLTGAVSGTTTVTMTGGMTFLTLAYAGKYRWETVYFPLNIGFVSSTVDSTGTFTRTMAAKVLVSYGIGFAMTETFNLEFITAATTVTSSTTSSSGTTIVPELGYLTNIQLNAKFLF